PGSFNGDGSVGISASGDNDGILAPPSTPEVATSGAVHRSELPQATVSVPAEVPDAAIEYTGSAPSP
ncbi:hypothetical protein BGZ46_006696, partial [Entomortierella lignicola]